MGGAEVSTFSFVYVCSHMSGLKWAVSPPSLEPNYWNFWSCLLLSNIKFIMPVIRVVDEARTLDSWDLTKRLTFQQKEKYSSKCLPIPHSLWLTVKASRLSETSRRGRSRGSRRVWTSCKSCAQCCFTRKRPSGHNLWHVCEQNKSLLWAILRWRKDGDHHSCVSSQR